MTNALAVLNGNTELSELDRLIMAEAEEEQDAFDYVPIRIKFPTGGMMAFSTEDGDILKPPLVAIIAISQKVRGFWPNKETLGLPPLCSSPDARQGFFDDSDRAQDQIKAALKMTVRHPALAQLSDARGPWSCLTCPLAQWVENGNGKRKPLCKEMRRLVILVQGWTMPAILTVPPTSIKAFDIYASKHKNLKGHAYFACRTKIELEKAKNADGTDYATLKLSIAEELTDDQKRAVLQLKKEYEAWVRDLGVSASDYNTEGIPAGERTVDAETGEILDGEAGQIPF